MKTIVPTGEPKNGIIETYEFEPSEPGKIGVVNDLSWEAPHEMKRKTENLHKSSFNPPGPIREVTPTMGPF